MGLPHMRCHAHPIHHVHTQYTMYTPNTPCAPPISHPQLELDVVVDLIQFVEAQQALAVLQVCCGLLVLLLCISSLFHVHFFPCCALTNHCTCCTHILPPLHNPYPQYHPYNTPSTPCRYKNHSQSSPPLHTMSDCWWSANESS